MIRTLANTSLLRGAGLTRLLRSPRHFCVTPTGATAQPLPSSTSPALDWGVLEDHIVSKMQQDHAHKEEARKATEELRATDLVRARTAALVMDRATDLQALRGLETAELEQRVEAARELMRREEIDALVLSTEYVRVQAAKEGWGTGERSACMCVCVCLNCLRAVVEGRLWRKRTSSPAFHGVRECVHLCGWVLRQSWHDTRYPPDL